MSEKKLRAVKWYDPAWTGPFCTRGGVFVCIKFSDGRGVFPVHGYIGDDKSLSKWTEKGCVYLNGTAHGDDLMCAEEIREPREFWINEYGGNGLSIYTSQKEAQIHNVCLIRTIHVREVLEGE